MKEQRPIQRKLEPSKVLLNGKRVHDAEVDPKVFARSLVKRRKQRGSRSELVEIGKNIKAKAKRC